MTEPTESGEYIQIGDGVWERLLETPVYDGVWTYRFDGFTIVAPEPYEVLRIP